MIERALRSHLKSLARRHPIVTLTGPRQSGKTTLCRDAFPGKPYVSLEPPDERDFARHDPRGFLARYPRGAIVDEVQRVPELLSYLQEEIDRRPRPGQFVLTGSQNLGVLDAVAQTLAGRAAPLQLLPLGLEEIRRFRRPPADLWSILWAGGYPRIYDRGLPADEWLASYTATYVERDVRHIVNVGDLLTFQTFMRLCAGRAGQLLNLSSLAADCGITHMTARSWVSVLEASFIAFRLPSLYRNIRKRLVKTPKLYFFDTGLLCYLLGIRTPAQIESHPLRGAIFECWVIAEIVKQHVHRGRIPRISFFKDRKGREVDLVIERGSDVCAVEVKSGQTPSSDYFTGVTRALPDLQAGPHGESLPVRSVVVYAGAASQKRTAGHLVSWSRIVSFPWTSR